MRTNRPTPTAEPVYTHGGARTKGVGPLAELRRSVMACMLWEDSFYESGESIADRICALVPKCTPEDVRILALEARTEMKLRHVPLMLAVAMCRSEKHRKHVAATLEAVIQRPDELSEFLALYWKDKRCPIAAQAKKGLARAFQKFNEYSLQKYNGDNAIKLRDVLFLVHAKPKDKEQERIWKRLVKDELKTPDTWETQLSAGKDKKKTWERLIREEKLGALALLRNLRNMQEADVDMDKIRGALEVMDVSRVLPFRFVAAAKHAPKLEAEIDAAMLRSCAQLPKLRGKTIVILDVSGSMYSAGNVSKRSDMTRAYAACALGAILRERCETPCIYATAGSDARRIHKTELVPARRGMALVEAIHGMSAPLGGGGIFLKQVLDYVKKKEHRAERIVVFTDEQDCDTSYDGRPAKAKPFGEYNYLINVSNEKNGIGYGPNWVHLDGFSEAVIDFIAQHEAE